ncbi:MAG: tol-pal system protein YbgF [Pseudomonadota bacterium]
MRVTLLDLVLRKYMSTISFLVLGFLVLTGSVGSADAQGNQAAPDNQAIIELSKRIEQLEGQMVDIQVILGTLQTLAQGQQSASASANGFEMQKESGNTTDPGRIAALETQVMALSQRLQQLTGNPVNPEPEKQAADAQQANSQSVWPNNAATTDNSTTDNEVIGFGEITVNTDEKKPIDSFIQKNLPQIEDNNTNSVDPKTDYEAAYGLLLQQDYDGAQQAFSEFLENYPQSDLAGNAQYWLGDTYYLQGDYQKAAGAFLKGYRTYSSSAKAPDSLLKLAMSLDRLNQRAAACASLSEISEKYPQAPQHLQLRAQQEARRLRC